MHRHKQQCLESHRDEHDLSRRMPYSARLRTRKDGEAATQNRSAIPGNQRDREAIRRLFPGTLATTIRAEERRRSFARLSIRRHPRIKSSKGECGNRNGDRRNRWSDLLQVSLPASAHRPASCSKNGAAVFEVNVGTGGSATSGVIGLPTAANGWSCNGGRYITIRTS